MRHLRESIFSKDLVTSDLPVEIKHKYIGEIENIVSKYGLHTEIVKNIIWAGTPFTETLKIDGIETLYKDVFVDHDKHYDLKVFVHPEISFPIDKDINDDSCWTVYNPQLWFQMLKQDGSVVSTKISKRFNKWVPLRDFEYAKVPFSKDYYIYFEEFKEKLEKLIKGYQWWEFNAKINTLIDKYLKNQKPIPLDDIKRLSYKLS